jgi:hypothetical protein
VVDGGGLENHCTRKGTGGSNPSPSATYDVSYFVSPRLSIHNVNWIVDLDAVLGFEVLLDHGVSPLWNSFNGGKHLRLFGNCREPTSLL